MKDSTFIFLIITIVVIFILHVGFKFAEPQEFPKIKVSGVSLMSKSTENYVPWKTEMFTDDLYKSMSEGVEIKFNISIDSGASTIKELSVTRTRKDDSTIEETKTINGPFEDGKSFDFTFTGKGDENFVGEHIFKVKYKLPYGNELELENEFSTTIVGADLSIATEIVKDSAHTLRFETKKKITFDKSLPFEYRGNFSRLSSQTGWEYTNNMISGPPEDAITKCGEKCNAITEGDGCPGFAIDFRTDGSVNCMTYIAKQASYYNPGREQCRHHPEEQEPVDGQGPCSTQYVMGTHGGYEGGLHWRKSGDAQQAQGGEAQGGEAQGEDVQGDFTASKMDSDISDIEPIPEHCTDENGDLLQDPLIEGSNTKYNPNKTYQYKQPGHARHYVHYCQHFIDGPATDNLRDKECARHLCYKTAFGDYGEFEDGEGRGICAGECWDRFKREPYQDPVSPDCKMTNRSYMPEDWIGWKRWKPQEIYGTDGELTPSSDPGREKAWIAQERKITKAATGDGKKCCEQLGYGSDCEDPLGPDDETVIGGKLFHLERIVTRSNDDEEAKYKGQHLIDYFDNKTGFTGKCDNNFVRAIGEREPPVSMIRVNVSDDPENPIWEDVLPDWVNGDLKGCSPAQQYVAKSIEKDLYELTTDEDKERYLGSAFSDPNAWGEIIGGHLNDYYESGGARQPFWQQT